MPNPQVVVDFIANTNKLNAASSEVAGTGAKIGAGFRKALVPAVGALGAITLGAGKAVSAASALNEQVAASGTVFGKHAKAMQRWAQTGADAFGLSATEALGAANAFGNMFKAVGFTNDETAKMSRSMTQLAGDMGSFFDVDPSEMLDKLRSGLAGEAEPLRRFGVLMSDATIKAFAYSHGIAKQGATLTEAQKVQARYGFIMQETARAQGDFARTSDSVANKQRTLAAESENMAAAFGKALLPAAEGLLKVFQAVMGTIGRFQGALTALIAVIAAVAAIVIGVNAAMAIYNTVTTLAAGATKVWAAAQWLLNAAMTANPIGLIVVGIAALVAALIVAYKTSDTFRGIVDAAFSAVTSAAKSLFNWIKANWPLLVSILGGPLAAAAVLVVRHWDTIKSVTTAAWNAVRSTVTGVIGAVQGALSGLASWISGFASGVLSTAIGRVRAIFDRISDAAHDVVGDVRGAMNSVVSAILAVVDRVASAASSVAAAIKRPINAVISAWNGVSFTIPSISIPKIKIGKKTFGGGSLGGQTIPFPNVPLLAAGGVVSDPTLALVGEGVGREIVAPEALLREIVGSAGGPEVRVFIGDTELRGLVRTEIVDANTGIARTLLAAGA